MENTLLGAIGARPPVWIFSSWELNVTLALTEEVGHVSSVLTQRLMLSTASRSPPNAAVFITAVQKPALTFVLASNRVLIPPVCTMLVTIANLRTTKAHGSVLARIKSGLLTADSSIGLNRLC